LETIDELTAFLAIATVDGILGRLLYRGAAWSLMREEGVLPANAPPLGATIETDLAEHGFALLRGAMALRARGGGQRAEIASVERVGGPRVHQENFVLPDDAAALPDRKRAAAAVALSGLADFDCVDSDAAADATDPLSGHCRHVFQQRHAARQIAAIGKETGKGFGRSHDNQVDGVNTDDPVDGVETDRHAGAGVPDEPRRAIIGLRERCCPDAERRDRENCAAADHGATPRRMSQALWRARV